MFGWHGSFNLRIKPGDEKLCETKIPQPQPKSLAHISPNVADLKAKTSRPRDKRAARPAHTAPATRQHRLPHKPAFKMTSVPPGSGRLHVPASIESWSRSIPRNACRYTRTRTPTIRTRAQEYTLKCACMHAHTQTQEHQHRQREHTESAEEGLADILILPTVTCHEILHLRSTTHERSAAAKGGGGDMSGGRSHQTPLSNHQAIQSVAPSWSAACRAGFPVASDQRP